MRARTESDYRRRILKAVLHLEENLDRAPALEELAAVACFSPFHFHRIFRALVGEPVYAHTQRLRLERAARQLAATGRSVTRIAFDAGYEALEPFSRAFRARFGTSPTAFRRAAQLAARATGERRARVRRGRGREHAGAGALQVSVQTLAPIAVVFVRHVGPYDQVGAAWGRLYAWAARAGLLGPGVEALGIPHDDPHLTADGRIRYDACLALEYAGPLADDVGRRVISGGEYAVTEYVGDYAGVDAAYAGLYGEWLPASGREPADAPGFEVYVDPPETDPARRRTRLHIPLAPRPG